jgi:quercetin dioxygenase-like cupin family protein
VKLEDTMQISPADEGPPPVGPADFFTGDVMVKPLFGDNAHRQVTAAQVTFSARARTAWHTHRAGQTLIMMSGSGWIQQWGGQKQRINPGDVFWTPPGVKHWHGATSTGEMTHPSPWRHRSGSGRRW